MKVQRFEHPRSVSQHVRAQPSQIQSSVGSSNSFKSHNRTTHTSFSLKSNIKKRSISQIESSNKENHQNKSKNQLKTLNFERMERIKNRVMSILKKKIQEGELQKILEAEVERLCEKYFIKNGFGSIFYDQLVKEYETTMINFNKKLIMDGTLSHQPSFGPALKTQKRNSLFNKRSKYDRDNDNINEFYNSPSHLRYVYQSQYRPDQYHKITNTLLLPSIQEYYSKFVELTKKKDKRLKL